jgi:hypothetical protein
MAMQYAKIKLDYNDYLIDLADVQKLMDIFNKSIRLSSKYDSASGDYMIYREGKPEFFISLAKDEETNAPIYVKLEGE